MSISTKGEYPPNWEEIARKIKEKNNWRCERCGIPDSHNPKDGNILTVHHLDGDKSNCEEWNLACLCARCHLHMQHINIFQGWLFPELHSEWFKPHLEGWMKARKERNGK